jgi:hypothetical protein
LSNGDLYSGREQTFVKHFILQNYLERFAITVGSRWNTLTYVDCFSGPWKVKSEESAKRTRYTGCVEPLETGKVIPDMPV